MAVMGFTFHVPPVAFLVQAHLAVIIRLTVVQTLGTTNSDEYAGLVDNVVLWVSIAYYTCLLPTAPAYHLPLTTYCLLRTARCALRTAHCCALLRTAAHCCALLRTAAYCCVLLCTAMHCCALLGTAVSY